MDPKFRGWIVRYTDGTIVREDQFDRTFMQLPRLNDVESVALVFDGRVWVIKGKKHLFEYKTMSQFGALGVNLDRVPPQFRKFFEPRIEARHVGYWEDGKKVIYSLNENTGQLVIHAENP